MPVRTGILVVALLSTLEFAPPDSGKQNIPPTNTPVSAVAVPQQNTRPIVVVPTPPTSVPQTPSQGPMVADLTVAPTTTMVVPLVNPDSPCQEWVETATNVGWPKDREVIERMVAIMWRESRCTTDAYKADDPNGGSLGLMQINKFWCKPSAYWPSGYLQAHDVLQDCDQLFDPVVNLHASWVIYMYSYNRHGGDGWNPWKL